MNCALEALRSARTSISLCGVEVYEGVLGDEVGIRQFLARAVRVTAELAQQKRFDRNPIILSGAGSAWYDVVAEEFSKVEIPVDVVLRPGCYLTHDVGAYREAQDRILKKNPIAREMTPALTPALQLWAYVQSVPESTRAIIGLGKRDAAFDSGLPTPALHYRPGWTEPLPTPAGWKLVKLMDQHAYLEIRERSEIRVGDMLGFDISHPCLTFDKWRFISVIDSAYRVIDVVETFF
jgi:D-serine dehydratase